MTMLTIKETSEKTGLSSYEIRRRVHAGNCPYTRVGDKKTKILIYLERFVKSLEDEALESMDVRKTEKKKGEDTETIGYNKIRKI